MERQSTITRPVSITGRGLHSGKDVLVTFRPAPVDHGIVFMRTDCPGRPLVHASVNHVYDTSRGTSIMENQVEVKTVEHMLAALAGLSIDNVLIEIDAEETPILDGSARLYIEKLKQAGRKELEAKRMYISVDKTLTFKMEELGIELSITPAEDFQATVDVDYGTEILSKQRASIDGISSFKDIADSRTFVFLHELQYLIANNLVKGGDVDNAIVFVAQKPEQHVLDQLATFFNKKDINITENGTLNHNPLRYDNEPARHKLLDLIGDLYLLGKPIKGHIKATKPGHFSNVEFAKLIQQEILQKKCITA